MPRKALTPSAARIATRAHLAAAERAIAALDRILCGDSCGASDDYVCDCPDGNGAGITEVECGCRAEAAALAAAKVLEAAGCYVRRATDKNLLV